MADRARMMSGAVESWSPAKFLVEGTCLDCDDACTAGYEVAEGAAKLSRIRRWATRHAMRNAGHAAIQGSAVTGPVERVPLTDEHLLQLETLWLGPTGTGRTSQELTAARLEQFGRIALEDVPGLLAELRESRAREQELRIHCAGLEASLTERIREREARQQRIDKALAKCDSGLARRGVATEQLAGLVRAALTGTEATDGPAGR